MVSIGSPLAVVTMSFGHVLPQDVPMGWIPILVCPRLGESVASFLEGKGDVGIGPTVLTLSLSLGVEV